jgi:hypothetical protein
MKMFMRLGIVALPINSLIIQILMLNMLLGMHFSKINLTIPKSFYHGALILSLRLLMLVNIQENLMKEMLNMILTLNSLIS